MQNPNFQFRLAKWVMDHRAPVLAVFALITLGFLAGFPGIEIRTIFKDLLPKDDPYVQVYYDHPNFGSPLTVFVMVERKDGDIYTPETLQKVWNMTRDIDLTPSVDHTQVISISTEKLRYVEATPAGVDVKPLMGDFVPKTEEDVKEFRRRVEQSPNARNFYISRDEKATMIQATFQDSIDYGVAFEFINKEVIDKYADDDHEIYLAGQPILTGWVYDLRSQTFSIFAITLSMLMVALVLYMRNIAGTLTPIICSLVAAIWGFGLVGWLKSPIEPLLLIVPLLLVARSFSHCVQFTERFYEIYAHIKDKRKSAEITMGVMVAPSVLGVVTDALGIIFIAVAPISAMERFALFCGFWAFCIIPTGVFLISILLSYMPDPNNIDSIINEDESAGGFHAFQRRLLDKISRLTYGKPARITTVVMAVTAVAAVYLNFQIKIGNPVEGSNLLWEDSEFNTAVRAINRNFPGMNTLEIIIESKNPQDSTNRVAFSEDAMKIRSQLQALMETDDVLPPRATLSFSDYMMEGNRLFAGGNPQWLPVDPNKRAAYSASQAVLFGSTPLNFSHVMDFEGQHSTVSFWYKDNKQETVDHALAMAEKAVEQVDTEHELFTVRMGTGFIALQQAMNEVVKRYHWIILGLLNIAIFVVAAYAYKSVVGAIIVLIPVNLSNFMLVSTMHVLGIGLDINSVMVTVLGVGVGIDYGIYLLSRICEEYNAQDRDWGRALTAALTTTGKAIMFTATIMLIGILPWYFLSDLKFMADMGLLLVAIMLINMVLALVLLPLLVWLIKPKFAGREDLMVGESVDLSQFMPAENKT